MKKRILAMLLAVVMVFGLLPMTAFATQETDPAVAAILARIGALPDPADFPTMTKGELQAVLDEAEVIFTLYDALTKEQQGQIDLSPVRAMYEAEDYLGSAPVANPTAAHTHKDATGADVDFQPWDYADSLPTEGSYYLTKDVTLGGSYTVTGNLNLCLNDKVINLNGRSLEVSKDATLTLYDCGKTIRHYDKDTVGGVVTNSSSAGVIVYGRFTMNGGTIYGNENLNSDNGGGVYVAEGGSFTMNGGTICGNMSSLGSGVYADCDATFTMNGGTICGNYSGVFGKNATVSIGGTAAITDNLGPGVETEGEGKLTLGGAAVIAGNILDVYPCDLRCTTFILASPAAGMSVGLYDNTPVTDAKAGDVQYFFSNNPTKYVTYDNRGKTFKLTDLPSGIKTITLSPCANGVLTVSGTDVIVNAGKGFAAQGKTVKVTGTPAKGYLLKSVTADQGVTPAKQADGTYTFAMPAANVIVTAKFESDHTHAFAYSASGAVLTATCTSGCPDGYDTTPLSITLTGDVDTDAAAVKAWNDAGAATATLSYYAAGDTTTPLTTPVKSGKYVAKVTASDKTASLEFDYVSPYYYINEKNEKVELETMPTIVTKDTTTLAADGWYYVKGTVTINNAVALNGNANLILADGASLEINKNMGIKDDWSNGYSLTVFGQTEDSGSLTINSDCYGSSGYATCIFGNINVTVNGGNIKMIAHRIESSGARAIDGGSLTVNGGNVEISAIDEGQGGSAYSNGVEGANVTVNGGKVKISATGKVGGEYSFGNGVLGKVTVTGGELEISGINSTSGVGVGYGNDAGIDVSGTGVLTVYGSTKSTVLDNSAVSGAVKTSADGATWSDWDEKTDLSTFKYLKLTTGACAELTHDGVATMYKTLKEAIAAAVDGDTVKLTSNVKGDGIVIPAEKFKTTGLTIDLGGFTYTVDGQLVGSTNTETNGFQLLKGNKITMTNGKIDVGDNATGKTADGEVKECRILIQNYSDLTLDGVELDGSKLKDSRTDRGTYTLSNCCGNTELTGKTAIKASTEETDPSFAFDTDEKTGYTKPSVTVNGADVVITGDVELSGGDLTLTAGTISGALKGDKGNGTVTKAATFTATASDGYGWDKDNKLIKAEAEIDGAAYPTIEEAIEAAQDGDIVKLTSDLKLTKQLEISKAITLDGIGKKIDGTGISGTGAILVTAGATLKNFELTGPNTNTSGWDSGEYGIKFYQANGAALTDVTVTGANAGIQVNGGSVTMTDTIDVSGNEFGGIEVCKKGALVISAATLKNDTEDAANNQNPVLWNDGDGKVENMGTITGSGSLNKKLTDDTTKDHYFLSGTPEAEINGQPYLTLADALKDAKANQTVELLDNLTLTEQLVIDKVITLKGNGKTVTRTPNTGAASTRAGILVKAAATLTNLTVSGPNTTASGWDEGEFGIKFFNADGATMDEVTVTGANAGIQVNGGKVYLTGNINVSGNEFGGIELCHGGKLDISLATLKNDGETDANPVLWNDDTKGEIKFSEDQPLYVKPEVETGKDHYYLSGAAKLTSGGVDSYYRTLEDALAAAQSGDTVTLLNNITTEGFTVPAGVTLDLNGKTVTPATAPNFKGISNKGTIIIYGANKDQLGYLLYDAVDANGGKYITGEQIGIGDPLEAGIGSNTEILAKRTGGKQSITVTVTGDSSPKLVIWNLPVGKDTEITVNGKLNITKEIEIKGKLTCTTLTTTKTITLTDGGQLIVTDLKDAADAAETAIDTAAGENPSEAVKAIVTKAKADLAALADPTTVGSGDNTVAKKVAAIAAAADKACLDIAKEEAIAAIEERAGSENRRSEEVQGNVETYTGLITEATTVDEVNELLAEAFEAIPEQSECPIPGFIGWIVNSVLRVVRWIIARITFEKYEPIIIGGAIVKIIGDVFVR